MAVDALPRVTTHTCPFMAADTLPRVTTRLLFMATAKGSTTHFLEHYVLHTGLLGQYPLAHTLIGLEQLKSELLGKITCHLQDQPASTGGDQLLSTCLIRENTGIS